MGGQFTLSEKGNLRYVKFNGSSPELVPKEKLEGLFSNPNILFARKFDTIQGDVIKTVSKHFGK